MHNHFHNSRALITAVRSFFLHLAFFIALLLLAPATQGQVLKAKWVEESELRIEEIRKADLRIIIIDKEGNPVARCPVHIEQVQHAFRWGVRLPRELPEELLPTREQIKAAPLWRSFSGIALDAHTQWPITQPDRGKWDFGSVEKQLAFARERGLSARWGSVVSTDPGRMPGWAAGLKGDELRAALEAHTKEVVSRFGKQVDQLDVVTQMIDHRFIEKELGFAAVRRLYQLNDYERERSTNPVNASSSLARSMLAFDDAFAPARLQKALRQVTAFREGFVPFDGMAIEVRFTGSLVEAPITRNLEWLGDPGIPVTVVNLEVSGDSKADAAVNLETALRAMFSQPCVEGIYFAGLRSRDLQNEDAALMEDDGTLTPSGELVDRMVRQHWWTDVTAAADDLGNVRQRVFAGAYRISASLPDGSAADVHVRISPGQSRLVLMQPIKAKPADAQVADADKHKEPGTPSEGEVLIKPVIDGAIVPVKEENKRSSSSSDSSAVPIPGRSRLEFMPER